MTGSKKNTKMLACFKQKDAGGALGIQSESTILWQ
jgi:hypothetical protein